MILKLEPLSERSSPEISSTSSENSTSLSTQSNIPIGDEQTREILTKMEFGDTEIKIQAIDAITGKSVRAEIDFLCL